jgi:hypothetical protein
MCCFRVFSLEQEVASFRDLVKKTLPILHFCTFKLVFFTRFCTYKLAIFVLSWKKS